MVVFYRFLATACVMWLCGSMMIFHERLIGRRCTDKSMPYFYLAIATIFVFAVFVMTMHTLKGGG